MVRVAYDKWKWFLLQRFDWKILTCWIHDGGRFLEVVTWERWSHMEVGLCVQAEPFAINFVL